MRRCRIRLVRFGISDTGIHLLRSNFNYKTIGFSSLDEIRIKKGRQVNNWIIALLFGASLVALATYVLYNVLYEYFVGSRVHRFYVTQFILPVLPLVGGAYCLYASLKKGMVLQVIINKQIKNLPIESIHKTSGLNEFTTFLQTNELTKYKFRITE